MTALRYIGGFMLTLVLFPIMGLFWLGCVVYHGLSVLWTSFREFWFSISDPAYIPNIGYGGTIRRYHERQLAAEAVAKGDWASAVSHWKNAARLYDVPSMHKLGECFETGKGVTANGGAAYEYYYLAEQYGMAEDREACSRLQKFRFPSRQRKEFAKTMWI